MFRVFLFLSLCLTGLQAQAFRSGSFLVGIGHYMQNSFGETTSNVDASPSMMGASSFPLNFKYDWEMFDYWYLSPQLTYSLFPRSSAGDSATTTMTHLYFPVGRNFAEIPNGNFEWFFGPGIMRYDIKGKGGVAELNNGSSSNTDPFALPKKNVTVQLVTLTGGAAWNFARSRVAVDLVIEGGFSSKMTESLMISYGFRFGGY